MRTNETDRLFPFFVSWVDSTEDESEREARFNYREDACAYADELAKRVPCVWLGELGKATNKSEMDWIFTWWTNATGDGELPQLGAGYAFNADEVVAFTPYEPAA